MHRCHRLAVGDPARANMLAALMDGRALTAKELAYTAHVTPQTASGHLAKLADGGLLAAEKQGRHRYYRLASPLVGQMLEGVMAVPGPEPSRATTWRGGEALRTARTCYDHLAGRLGVALADALNAQGHVTLGMDGGEVTEQGQRFLDKLRCVARAGAARVLPAVPGLERAAAASRRPGGRGAGVPVFRAGLDRAPARHARGGDHQRRERRISQHIRVHAGRLGRAATPRLPWR